MSRVKKVSRLLDASISQLVQDWYKSQIGCSHNSSAKIPILSRLDRDIRLYTF